MTENEPSGSTCRVWLRYGLGRAEALLGGEHVRAGAGAGAAARRRARGVRPARARGDGAADAVEQLAQLALGGGGEGRHGRQCADRDHRSNANIRGDS
jgi:hypothetical protein